MDFKPLNVKDKHIDGNSKMKKNVVILILVLINFSKLYGEHNLNTSLGGGYDSHIVLKNLANKKNASQKKGGVYLHTDLIYNYYDNLFMIDIGNSMDYIPDFNQYSKIEQMISTSKSFEFENSDLTFGLALTNALTNFDVLEPYFISGAFFGEFFYNYSDELISIFSVGGDYQYGLLETISYLKGLSFFAEIGIYNYYEDSNYLMFSIKTTIFDYKNVSFSMENSGSLILVDTPNSYLYSYFQTRWKHKFSKLIFNTDLKLYHNYWFNDDKWDDSEKTVTKLRLDYGFEFSIFLQIPIFKSINFKTTLSYQKNISTLGEEQVDYIDWNYNRYLIFFMFDYEI